MESKIEVEIEGQPIIAIREMTDAELEREGWTTRHGNSPPVIELESGVLLYPSMDSEGNGPGAMFGVVPDGDAFFLSP